jgi:IS1 family transposase
MVKFGIRKGIQRFRCPTCKRTRSDIPQRPLDNMRVPFEKAVQVIKLLIEGTGVRACERLTGLNRRTVLGILETAGQRCARLMDGKIRNLKIESCQCDELYAFVHCKEPNNKLQVVEWGDQYTFLAVDRASKLILSFHTGKRTPENTNIFMEDLQTRIDASCQLTTDGYWPYIPAVANAFGRQAHFAQQRKVFAHSVPMPKRLRHELKPQGVMEVKTWIKSGNPNPALISTSHVERMNLSIRLFNRRFTRLTLGFSKKIENLKLSLALLFAYFNFCRVHMAHNQTPAMAAGLTDHAWTVEELLKSTF